MNLKVDKKVILALLRLIDTIEFKAVNFERI